MKTYRTIADQIPIIMPSRIVLGIFIAAFWLLPSNGQLSPTKPDDVWRTILYDKDVDYGSFSCDTKYMKQVKSFFKKNPLKNFIPICHNDCPVVSCRPVIRFPVTARAVRATGSVKVHVLVDEKGKVLYARVLTGHPLLREVAIQGACRTEFKEYPYRKHQGIMEFTVDNNDYLTVPFSANSVWE
ncbi:MAG: energy transducer TonB [Chloracidobacterium sp.]|nr:energy transducer TonB [Chloracidobacterium sp.]